MLLDRELQKNDGWNLVPVNIKEEYVRLNDFRGFSKIMFLKNDFSFTSEEIRNIFFLSTFYVEWRGLHSFLPCKWQKLYPVCYISTFGWMTVEETYERINNDGVFPHAFVDASGKIHHF